MPTHYVDLWREHHLHGAAVGYAFQWKYHESVLGRRIACLVVARSYELGREVYNGTHAVEVGVWEQRLGTP